MHVRRHTAVHLHQSYRAPPGECSSDGFLAARVHTEAWGIAALKYWQSMVLVPVRAFELPLAVLPAG